MTKDMRAAVDRCVKDVLGAGNESQNVGSSVLQHLFLMGGQSGDPEHHLTARAQPG